jgi:hypothetical protein
MKAHEGFSKYGIRLDRDPGPASEAAEEALAKAVPRLERKVAALRRQAKMEPSKPASDEKTA